VLCDSLVDRPHVYILPAVHMVVVLSSVNRQSSQGFITNTNRVIGNLINV